MSALLVRIGIPIYSECSPRWDISVGTACENAVAVLLIKEIPGGTSVSALLVSNSHSTDGSVQTPRWDISVGTACEE